MDEIGPDNRFIDDLPLDIPIDPQEFYQEFPPVIGRDGQPITYLSDGDKDLWEKMDKHKETLFFTESADARINLFSIRIIYHILTKLAIIPIDSQVLIVADDVRESSRIMNEILYLFANSRFRGYVVQKHKDYDDSLFGHEKTAMSKNLIRIRNPSKRGTLIEIKGYDALSPSNLGSFMNVMLIFVKNITVTKASPSTLDQSLDFLGSRFAMNRGTMIIQTPFNTKMDAIMGICKERIRELPDGRKKLDLPGSSFGYWIQELPLGDGIDLGRIDPNDSPGPAQGPAQEPAQEPPKADRARRRPEGKAGGFSKSDLDSLIGGS